MVIFYNCAEIEKGNDFATGIISDEIDGKFFSQVPDEKNML